MWSADFAPLDLGYKYIQVPQQIFDALVANRTNCVQSNLTSLFTCDCSGCIHDKSYATLYFQGTGANLSSFNLTLNPQLYLTPSADGTSDQYGCSRCTLLMQADNRTVPSWNFG